MSSESCFPLKYVLAYQTQTDISAKKVPVLKCSPLTGMVGEVYEGSFLFWIGNCLGDNWLEVLKGFCMSEKREEGESGALLTSVCKVKEVDAQFAEYWLDPPEKRGLKSLIMRLNMQGFYVILCGEVAKYAEICEKLRNMREAEKGDSSPTPCY